MNPPASPISTAAVPDCDIAICGGGLVGASLALMLAQLGLKAVLIESVPAGQSEQPSFDERTTALSNGSRRVFEALGVWSLIERAATPIRRIHISDQGRFGFARLSAEEQGVAALGFVVPNRVMGEALWRRLREECIEVIAPARVTGIALQQRIRRVALQKAEGVAASIDAKLVVAADGAQSSVREAAGIGASRWDYAQTAIIANATVQRFHEHVAYERFTPDGPIAVLPLSEGRVGVVWTLAPEAAREVLAYTDEQFLARFQREFGFRLGRFLNVGRRHSYPLALTRADEQVAERLAIIGNAAQGLHPVAGQGLNLGLRDAACLAEVLADARGEHGSAIDAGDGLLLNQYRDWRAQDRGRIVAFTDGLVRVFNQPWGPMKALRDMGLLAFDLMPPAKDALARLSLGAAGRIPRLARGAPLMSTLLRR